MTPHTSYESALRQHYDSVRDRLRPTPKARIWRQEVPRRRPLFTAPIIEVAPVPLIGSPSWKVIVTLVALRHGVTFEEIIGRDRNKHITAARRDAIHLVHTHTRFSLNALGRLFGRDHTSIMYALGRVRKGGAV